MATTEAARGILRIYSRSKMGDKFMKRVSAPGNPLVRALIAGNHKANGTKKSAELLFARVLSQVGEIRDIDIVVAPPFTALESLSSHLKAVQARSHLLDAAPGLFENVHIAAQTVFWEDSGAYTGEVTAPQARDEGAEFVILGHSERRQYRGETDAQINQMMIAAFRAGLRPILCMGESGIARQAGDAKAFIESQILGALGISSGTRITLKQIAGLTIAYEPVWAIGKGKTPATPDQAEEVHVHIRHVIEREFGLGAALKMRILYGGNVSPENIAGFMAMDNIDGALVGGASLVADKFAKIIKFGLAA